jgi:FMN phosphatase YigB (HAD superfamily)
MKLHAVTFDCWSTLLYEHEPLITHEKRVAAALEIAHSLDPSLDHARVRRAYDAAWKQHFDRWHVGLASGGAEIARWTLEALEIPDPGAVRELEQMIAEAGLESEIGVLDGALEVLEKLEARRVRRALICDTGLSPGRVVRRLLERADLLGLLEVQLFSDEEGMPKPDPRMFRAALTKLDVAPGHALHVGDLRRTDVAGARGVGMRTARIRGHHDDVSDLPEADHVVDSHRELWELLR